MAFSNLGKVLEIVEEVLDVAAKNSAALSGCDQGTVDAKIYILRGKISKLQEKDSFN